jgi:hypothetical protein
MTPTPTDLANTSRLCVPRQVVGQTWSALRGFGVRGFEGFVLWLGNVATSVATIEFAFVPTQSSIQGEEGVGYFVTSDTLFQLNRELHRSGLRLIAQIHSHPAAAYHSTTDDAYAVVTAEGGFSIVVPNFAAQEPDLRKCAIYRLRNGRWKQLLAREIVHTIDWESI